MAWHSAKPVEAKGPSGSGVSMALRVTKKTRVARFTMTAAAQVALFGGSIEGRALLVSIGYGEHEGLMALALVAGDKTEPSAIKVVGGIKGSVAFSVAAWDLLPRDKRPAASCTILSEGDNPVVLRLPDWCRPSKSGGRIADEHKLAPVPRAKKPTPAAPQERGSRLSDQAAALGRAVKG